jgi:hypothetical protein
MAETEQAEWLLDACALKADVVVQHTVIHQEQFSAALEQVTSVIQNMAAAVAELSVTTARVSGCHVATAVILTAAVVSAKWNSVADNTHVHASLSSMFLTVLTSSLKKVVI